METNPVLTRGRPLKYSNTLVDTAEAWLNERPGRTIADAAAEFNMNYHALQKRISRKKKAALGDTSSGDDNPTGDQPGFGSIVPAPDGVGNPAQGDR